VAGATGQCWRHDSIGVGGDVSGGRNVFVWFGWRASKVRVRLWSVPVLGGGQAAHAPAGREVRSSRSSSRVVGVPWRGETDGDRFMNKDNQMNSRKAFVWMEKSCLPSMWHWLRCVVSDLSWCPSSSWPRGSTSGLPAPRKHSPTSEQAGLDALSSGADDIYLPEGAFWSLARNPDIYLRRHGAG